MHLAPWVRHSIHVLSIAGILASSALFSAEGEPAKCVTVKGKQEKDEKGQPYIRVIERSQKIVLEKTKLHQMVGSPTGNALYACFAENTNVLVFEPNTFNVTHRIALPRSPVSLWCDATRLVAACPESKQVAIVNLEDNSILQAASFREVDGAEPLRVIGRAPDGAYMTIWKVPDSPWWFNYLVLVDESGRTRVSIKGGVDWAVFTHQDKRVFAQNNFDGFPSGVPSIYDLTTGKELILTKSTGLGEKHWFHRTFAHCFITFDRNSIVMPCENRDDNPVIRKRQPDGYRARTRMMSTDLSSIQRELDGVVFAEVPKENLLVGWSSAGEGKDECAEIKYYNRASGHIERRISAQGLKPKLAEYVRGSVVPRTVFLPGNELFIYQHTRSADGSVEVVRCGPIANADDAKK